MESNKDIVDIRAAEAILHKKKKYLLCYHNFNVKNCKKSAEEIRKIAAAAGSPISIAVVPSIGGVPESEADDFREEIGKFVQEGYEILLHGVRHNADLFIKRNPIGKLALAISHNGAEFAGLNKKVSQMLLNRSIALWKAHGFGRPSGFIAPVWLDNKHLKKQVLEEFNFYEDLFYIYRKEDLPLIRSAIQNGCGADAPGNLAHYLVDKTTVHAWPMPAGRFDIGSLDTYQEAKQRYK